MRRIDFIRGYIEFAEMAKKEFPQLTIEELMLLYSLFTAALIKAICEVKKENAQGGGKHDSLSGV